MAIGRYERNRKLWPMTVQELRDYCDARSIGYNLDWDKANLVNGIEMTETIRRSDGFNKHWVLPKSTRETEESQVPISIPIMDKSLRPQKGREQKSEWEYPDTKKRY